MHQNETTNQNVAGSSSRETHLFIGAFPASIEATPTEKKANPSGNQTYGSLKNHNGVFTKIAPLLVPSVPDFVFPWSLVP
jgi:hypothetical protein